MFEGELFYNNGFWIVQADSEYCLHPSNIKELELIILDRINFDEVAEELEECAYVYKWEDSHIDYTDRNGNVTRQKCRKLKGIEKQKVDYYILKNIVIANQLNGTLVDFDIEYEVLDSQIHDEDMWKMLREEFDPNAKYNLDLIPEKFRKNSKIPTREDLMNYFYVNYYCLNNYKMSKITNIYAKVNNLTYLI